MRKINDFENVKESGQRRDLPAGGYVCVIYSVEDFPEKEYLRIVYDIAEGEFKEYGAEVMESAGFNPLSFIRSYKDSAKGFFKHFVSTIEKSNPGYAWNWDERTLVGKKFGAVVALEQYRKSNGDVRVRAVVDRELPVEEVRKGNFKVPEMKYLPGFGPGAAAPTFSDANLSDKDLEDLF